jgi:hypothetical protein
MWQYLGALQLQLQLQMNWTAPLQLEALYNSFLQHAPSQNIAALMTS